ncbi:hypothetical protein BKA70DRAFT_1417589 [Coprinopsis sp. MPI-PUGE-AT-0042]|nr:hypothetical protein BKA70DRAFT_1417589 [Coprinopsis sp. MPI-PUGE-AT-0042]
MLFRVDTFGHRVRSRGAVVRKLGSPLLSGRLFHDQTRFTLATGDLTVEVGGGRADLPYRRRHLLKPLGRRMSAASAIVAATLGKEEGRTPRDLDPGVQHWLAPAIGCLQCISRKPDRRLRDIFSRQFDNAESKKIAFSSRTPSTRTERSHSGTRRDEGRVEQLPGALPLESTLQNAARSRGADKLASQIAELRSDAPQPPPPRPAASAAGPTNLSHTCTPYRHACYGGIVCCLNDHRGLAYFGYLRVAYLHDACRRSHAAANVHIAVDLGTVNTRADAVFSTFQSVQSFGKQVLPFTDEESDEEGESSSRAWSPMTVAHFDPSGKHIFIATVPQTARISRLEHGPRQCFATNSSDRTLRYFVVPTYPDTESSQAEDILETDLEHQDEFDVEDEQVISERKTKAEEDEGGGGGWGY